MMRSQISWRALGFLLATGLPGVLAGSLLLSGIKSDWVTAFVGLTIMSIALLNLFRFRSEKIERHDRTPWLAADEKLQAIERLDATLDDAADEAGEPAAE